MDYAGKLALATHVAELTIRPFAETLPPDRPPPPAAALARFEEMTNRRRALVAKLYAERLSEAQLLALEAHHGSEHARAVAAELPAIHAEVARQLSEMWGAGKSRHNVSVSGADERSGPTARIGVHLAVNEASQDLQRPEAIVKRLLDEEHIIQTTHAHLVREYLKAIEAGATGAELARFYTPDAEQVERPNRLNPTGGRSDLPTLLARAEKGKALLRGQRYEVLSLVAETNRVAAEVLWTGTLAVPLGTLAAGATLRAHIAMFFDMKNGLIHRQHNYDCFEAW